MAIDDDKINPKAGVAVEYWNGSLDHVALTQTGQPFLLQQMRKGFAILSASLYTRTLAGAVSIDVGIVPVGGVLGVVTLVIGGTTTKFKLNSNIIGLSTTVDANTGIATIVNKVVTDNNVFSTAFTINAAAAAGTFWGAARIQMDAAGVITTKVVAADQTFPTEALAKANAPAADAGKINLGTISIQPASGVAYTAGTTALTGAGITVNYNGVASGFVSCMAGSTPATITPVANKIIQGVMAAFTTAGRSVGSPPGALLVGLYTTDGSGVVVDSNVQLATRTYPLNGEMTINPIPG